MKFNIFTTLFSLLISTVIAFAQQRTLTQSTDKVCVGDAVRLTALGCDKTVLWSNGKSGNVILDTLQQSTNYTAVCMEGENVVFNYNATLIVTVFGNPQTPYLLCNEDVIKKGRSAKIQAFGCDGTITWNTGVVGREINVSPEVTTTYTAVCTNASGCSAEPISRTIIVYENKKEPTPDVSWRYGCNGESVIMSAAGCSGQYVWYRHTSLLGKVSKTEEIARGNSVEVTKGGNDVFYTARCQFTDCLGDASNRLQLAFVEKIDKPKATSVLVIDTNNPQAVDLNNALSKPMTSGGIYEFRENPDVTTSVITDPKNITKAGTYYVVERSRQGKCVSNVEKIRVETGKATKGATDVPAEVVKIAPTENSTTSLANSGVTQVTDVGAAIIAAEPNANLEELGIPGGFSPNGDGINDTFFIKNLGNSQPSLRVYNRFGHLVYDAEKYENDWTGKPTTGTFKDSSLGIPDGTYYYVLRMEDGRQKVSFLTVVR